MMWPLNERYCGPAYKASNRDQTYAVTIDNFAGDRSHKRQALQKLTGRLDKLCSQYLEDFQVDGDKPDELQ